MRNYEQDPPFAVQVEPTEGCSLACSFCALQTLRDNGADAATGKHGKNSAPYKHMTLATARRIASEIARLEWNPRIEFAMHGEPSMHPFIHDIIGEFRKALPKAYLMMTTNGSGFIKRERIALVFDAGLNTLAWDVYKHAKWNEQVFSNLWDYAVDELVSTFDYPKEKRGNPHTRTPGKRIVRIKDISTNTEGTHKLTNQGGNSGPREDVQQRCAKPFRELSIRWDGNVALCCDDWKGQYKIANVHNLTLDAIWQHPHFDAARRYLYRGKRSEIAVCSGCNVRTYRNGLLPDKMGKDVMLPPDATSRRFVQAAQAGKVFSIKEVK